MAEKDFLRLICESPESDEHRLIFADWLDENGQGERAEFIRVQVAFSANRENDVSRRLSTLIYVEQVPAKMLGVGPDWSWSGDCESAVITPRVGPGYTFRRGLVDRVTLTMSQFMGGPCWRCSGTGNGELVGDGTWNYQTCDRCHGTGTTHGLARELFERWPITGVRLDREPFGSDRLHSSHGYGIGWQKKSVVDRYRPAENATYGIPDLLFEFIPGLEHDNGAKYFESIEAAHAALSDAAVAYGRELVGLPPIKPQATPPNSTS